MSQKLSTLLDIRVADGVLWLTVAKLFDQQFLRKYLAFLNLMLLCSHIFARLYSPALASTRQHSPALASKLQIKLTLVS